MKPIIVPTILTATFGEFAEQIKRLAPLFKLIQIDVMDGVFVDNKSFEDIEKINELPDLPELELHLMAEHPLEEIEKWKKIKNIKKIIFHVESKDRPEAVCDAISGLCLTAGIALNPETPFAAIVPYLERVNEVLFLTVHPGHQGNPFVAEVGQKIRELNNQKNHPLIGVDGGINENNIAEVKSWGVDMFCVGSALTRTEDVKIAYKNLQKKLI